MIGSRGEERDHNPTIKIPISNPHYGTFPQSQSQSSPLFYPSAPPLAPPPNTYHAIPVGYQSVSYPMVVQEGIPIREPRLPFCGLGIGWALFICGFFFAAIPWYVGVFILLFVIQDYREKPGLVACTVAAALATVPVILKPFQVW